MHLLLPLTPTCPEDRNWLLLVLSLLLELLLLLLRPPYPRGGARGTRRPPWGPAHATFSARDTRPPRHACFRGKAALGSFHLPALLRARAFPRLRMPQGFQTGALTFAQPWSNSAVGVGFVWLMNCLLHSHALTDMAKPVHLQRMQMSFGCGRAHS